MKLFAVLGFAAGIGLSAALAPQAMAQDAAAGERVFNRCKACHALEAGQNKVGPYLAGIIGRPAGTAEGFRYSPINAAAGEAGLVWTEENIVAYLEDPQGFLEAYLAEQGAEARGRTRMTFRLRPEGQRLDVTAYLKEVAGGS